MEMRGIFLLILALTGSPPLAHRIFAQSAAENQVRHVKGQVLHSAALPSIRIRFAKPCKFAGSQEVSLYDRARAEQFFFVDADRQGFIRRMYLAQFEGFLPEVEGVYDYPDTHAVFIAGRSYLTEAGTVPDVPAALAQHPQSDVAHAASFLESKGYRFGKAVVFQRYRRLVDPAKRHEFILLYIEELGEGAGPDKEETMKTFSDRALKGFTVLR